MKILNQMKKKHKFKTMKKIIFSLIIFGLFQMGYSQKKELKTIDKQIKAGEYENALNTISSIKSLVNAADYKTKAKYYYLKGMARYQNGNGSFDNKILSVKDFNEAKKIEKSGTKIYTEITVIKVWAQSARLSPTFHYLINYFIQILYLPNQY